MSDIVLTQLEADDLIAMEKIAADDTVWTFPIPGASTAIPLFSPDRRESFMLDIYRGQINLAKVTYQNRARKVIQLVRIDLGGPSHRNPDGTEIGCPHLHLYREGYADKWAYAVPVERFPNPTDLWQTLHDFMNYCNIIKTPNLQRGLF